MTSNELRYIEPLEYKIGSKEIEFRYNDIMDKILMEVDGILSLKIIANEFNLTFRELEKLMKPFGGYYDNTFCCFKYDKEKIDLFIVLLKLIGV